MKYLFFYCLGTWLAGWAFEMDELGAIFAFALVTGAPTIYFLGWAVATVLRDLFR